jgi:lipase chaperone LimK
VRRVAVAIAALAALALVLARGGESRRSSPRPPGRLAGAVAPVVAAASAAARPVMARPAIAAPAVERPRSLRDVELDGAIAIERGRLVVDAALRRLFDHVLTAAGEVSDPALRRLIEDEARRRAPGHEAEVVAAFDRYLAYLGAAQELAAAAAGATPRQLLGRVETLQREHFPADADALFGADNALALATLDRSDVLSRGDLSPADRAAALAAIEERLPPAMRAQRARLRAPAEARAAVAEIRRRGGSDAEVHAVRRQFLGSEAADRLAELDRRGGEP